MRGTEEQVLFQIYTTCISVLLCGIIDMLTMTISFRDCDVLYRDLSLLK